MLDWTASTSLLDPMVSDVLAPSTWTIIGCRNGLRLFKEARDADVHGMHWDDHPALMAVGVIDATPEAVFSESDVSWSIKIRMVTLISFTKKLRRDWLRWGMRKRDLLLRRYWRREDDGTYGGGYVISPVDQGNQSVVKHMLAIDWKFWKSYFITSSAKYVTIRMLGRVAALREFFRAKCGSGSCSDFSSGESTCELGLPQSEKEHIQLEVKSGDENNKSEDSADEPQISSVRNLRASGSSHQLSDATDEFFDVINESDCTEALWSSDEGMQPKDKPQTKVFTAAAFVKRLHDMAGPFVMEPHYLKDSSRSLLSSWAMTDPSTFLIRSESYLHDNLKIKANGTLMQMVAADWLKSDRREDDLASRPGAIVHELDLFEEEWENTNDGDKDPATALGHGDENQRALGGWQLGHRELAGTRDLHGDGVRGNGWPRRTDQMRGDEVPRNWGFVRVGKARKLLGAG
ncbi:hypothetical protein ZIOFF_062717 [Zingiber officinale]|uniref:Protein ENHANCED DISEASE RESISTANCE 2 C-terminal domain-containing protein n=1 Tax=Zingiber officinale TaxID=94328 RepID=A0A8J5F0S3_ZINOF|nr:hypothetical protein ZIOFF_062717 [Zingiber officinale]